MADFEQNNGEYISEYYLVRSSALPEVYNNVMKVKELLKSGEVSSVNEAVKVVGMSRSAFYKYRDDIRVWEDPLEQNQITLVISFAINSEAISKIILSLSEAEHRIINIAQGTPRGGFSDIMISCILNPDEADLVALRRNLAKIVGVRQVEILN